MPLAAAAVLLLYAHNDCVHERPLFDALEHGFCAVEADVHLRGGELLVAHRWYEVDRSRTLEKLYLEPLRRLDRSKCPEFWLNIDVKTDAVNTWEALKGVRIPGVRVTISGNRAKELIVREGGQVDGDFSDIGKDPRAYPVISQRWWPWSRKSSYERAIARAHAAGQKVRLYGTRDWELQRELGADYLNADDLSGSARWLERSRSGSRK